jgi:hypothetical protein
LANAKIDTWLQLARAAAHGRVVEAHVAAATVLAALLEAGAARLDLLAAFLVAGGAGDAAAIFGLLALAVGEGEVALADADAVLAAAATAAALGEHAAKVLQGAFGDFVVALAIDLAPVRGFLELDRAARQNVPVGELRSAGRGGPGLPAGLLTVRRRHDGGTL